MANVFSPFGFFHLGSADGAPANFAHRQVAIANGNGTAIFRGDPVKLLSTGYVAQWTATTAASQLAGIFVGCQYLSSTGQGIQRSNYWPGSGATGDITAWVIPCILGATPQQFLVQTGNSAGGATAFAAADVYKNIDVALGSGTTANGYSTAYADQNTEATTATLPFRIVALYTGGILNPSVFSPWGGTGNGSDLTTANNYVIVEANTIQATGI